MSLKAGVSISLVNHVPEELIYITLKDIEVKLSSTSTGQILDASVGNIQVVIMIKYNIFSAIVRVLYGDVHHLDVDQINYNLKNALGRAEMRTHDRKE